MDRLTEFHGGIWGMSTKAAEKGYDRYSVFSKLAEFENLEVTPEQIREKDKLYAEKCRELAELKKKLTPRIGSTIWDNDFGKPCKYKITGFSYGNLNRSEDEEIILDQIMVYFSNSSGSITGSFAVCEIGKTVFLTREEAETQLSDSKNLK